MDDIVSMGRVVVADTEVVTEVISPEDYSELFIQTKEDEPVMYAEYDGETIGEFMDELYTKMESIPTNKDGFIDGTLSIQVTYHPN